MTVCCHHQTAMMASLSTVVTCMTSSILVLLWIFSVGALPKIPCGPNNCTAMDNTVCYDGFCVCRPGFTDMAGSCRPRKIGENCRSDPDCPQVPGSRCVNDTCECISGYIPDDNKMVCRARKLNDSCILHSDCSSGLANSTCSGGGVCGCLTGYKEEQGLCVQKMLNDSCTESFECTEVMNNTRCFQGRCVCAVHYVEHDDDECRLRRLDEVCREDVECNNTALESRVCRRRRCQCDIGYSQNSKKNTCQARSLGSSCMKKVDCRLIPHGTCLNMTCRCDTGDGYKTSKDNLTCEVRELHDACALDEDCQKIPNSACAQGMCSCLVDHREYKGKNDTKSFCKKNLLRDRCLSDQNCNITNSRCFNSTCTCTTGFISTSNRSHCRQRTINETRCGQDNKCQQYFNNSLCSKSGVCECKRRYMEQDDGYGCQFRYLGDSCVNDTDCLYSVDNSECVNTICRCESTHYSSPDNTSCNVKWLGGVTCSSDRQCSSRVAHSFCDMTRNATCHCQVGYHSYNFSACLEKRLHDGCSSHEDCNTTNPHSFCSPETRKCECILGFTTTFRNGSHLEHSEKPFCAKRKIGDPTCKISADCYSVIANSTCGICSNSPENSLCRQQCNIADDQQPGPAALSGPGNSSSCAALACVCSKGFISSDDRTRCEGRKLRESCNDDEDCSVNVPDSVCEQNTSVCSCRSGYKQIGLVVCKRRVIRDQCSQDSDCENAVPFSRCDIYSNNGWRVGQCVCKSGYQADNSTACRKRQIGDRTCAVREDCNDAVNNSYCLHGMCVCEQGHSVSADHKTCNRRKLNSSYCESIKDCDSVINNSKCENHKCLCVSGSYRMGDDVCVRRKIGDRNCRTHTDCSDAVNNSLCVNNTCVCVSGFVAKDANTCRKRKLFDGECQSRVDCTDAVKNSICYSSVCVCESGYFSAADNTVCQKRKLGDRCDRPSDCKRVIGNSDCVSGVCACMKGHDPQEDNSLCVPSPKVLGHACYSTSQCQKIDPGSICNQTSAINSTCECPQQTFVASNKTACIRLPKAVGDSCDTNYHCSETILNSFCGKFSKTCRCPGNYFVDTNGTVCHPEPRQLGDFCQNKTQCRIANSTCENSSCVCEYGYMQNTSTSCVERPTLPQYKPIEAPKPAICTNDKCSWTNSRCVPQPGLMDWQCRCDYRHARSYNSSQCVPIQTYQLDLHLAQKAETYDYVPLNFDQAFRSLRLPDSQELANKIILSGLPVMFMSTESPFKDRYVASEVTEFQNPDKSNQTTNKGVKAIILLHLTAFYLDATPITDIYNFMEDSLNKSHGNLGDSTLKVAIPFHEAVVFKDYDECAVADDNDCSQYATCINTLGSFMCVCHSRYDDVSKSQKRRPGRVCLIPTTTDDNSALCSSSNCETRWEFVGLAVTLFLLIVLAFIVYEIIQRKQTFTARKLYEKFGTTKIRKLRQASMKRIQERKKRRKEENKKQKEEEKQKKEELKRQKSEEKKLKEEEKKVKQEERKQRNLDKKEAKKTKKKGKSGEDVEWLGEQEENARSPSPVEIMHPPSLPFAVDIEENVDDDTNSLPGSINIPEMVSNLEESPV